ncbi:MAG: diacylglycerol kinase [Planctomycetota bacterium]
MQLTFIVNRASGGGEAQALATLVCAHGVAVHDLRRETLTDVVAQAAGTLVACGGDGTACAVLDAVARSGRDLPVAVVPFGTGNDLARHLGWPLTSLTWDDLSAWLTCAPTQQLDRWLIEGPNVQQAWFNYWSMGTDAAVVHRFHHLRRQNSWLTRSAAVNKALYAICGAQEYGQRLDGAVDMAMPPDAGAVVAANIPSYAGGLRLGPSIRANDGRFDLFALPGGFSLGLVIVRQRHACALGQYSELHFQLRRPMLMQIDGEPLRGRAGDWCIRHVGQVSVLAGPLSSVIRTTR